MKFKRTILQDNILIHKFIIERDINNIYLAKCNELYYNYKKKKLLKSKNYYNNLKVYYDKKYSILENDIHFFDLKYKKIIYNYNTVNNFNLDEYEKLLKDRVIHRDILINNYKKYFKSSDHDHFLRIYFDIFLKIQNAYFGKRY